MRRLVPKPKPVPAEPEGVVLVPDQSESYARHCGAARGGKLTEAVEVFRHWLHLPDPTPLHAVLATVVANRSPGDPVWLLLVGPPGCGKSELLVPLAGLGDVHMAATLTEASLLSGSPKRERAKDAKGGLLREIGDL